MSQFNGLTSSGLIDYLRESTETALDLSKNLTAARTPGEFFTVWTKFAEGQYSAAEKLAYQLTGRTLAGAKNFDFGSCGFGSRGHQGNGATQPASASTASTATEETENAAAIAELQEQADAFRSQMDELSAQVAALADRLGSQAGELSNRLGAQIAALSDKVAALEGRPLPRVKFSFGEPPHTGWTPSKVVVLGNDGNGNLVELPSTIEDGGFRYTGMPSFWIAIG